MLKNIEGIIFDLDGTLIDSMWVWEKIDIDFLKKYNIEMPKNLQKDIEGLPFYETAIYFKNTFNLPQSLEDIMSEWHDMVIYYYKNIIPLKNGVLDFIKYLKTKNLKLSIATCNSLLLTELIMKRTKLYSYFDGIVTGDEENINKNKAFPDIFLRAAKKINVEPSKCLVFEDTLTGITGAKKAGMKVFGVYDDFSKLYKNKIIEATDGFIEKYNDIFINGAIK